MVSTNSSPPVAMPMHVPQGHMVQQVLDENGTLQHVILSPDPMAGPGAVMGPTGPMGAGPPGGPMAGSASPPTSTVTTSATNTSSSVAPPSGSGQQFVPMTLYVSVTLHAINYHHITPLLPTPLGSPNARDCSNPFVISTCALIS